MLTKYAWNSLGQLVKEQTPDGGVTQFWYNDKQQLRVTQKANQSGKFVVTDYDDLGRVIRTCEVTSGSSGQTLADLTSAASGAYHVETVYSTAATLPSPYASLTQRYLLNRVSTAVTDEDGNAGTTDDRVTTYYSYDPHGNVEWVVSALPGMTSPVKVDYEYDLITGKVMQMNYQRGYQDQYFVKYAYDADLRVTEVKTSTDSVIWEKDAGYGYYAHGPLKRMELGQEKVSGVDHAYTIHGWLKGINHPSLDNGSDPGNDGGGGSDYPKDAFGMTLWYYENDFVKSGSPYEQGNGWSYTPTSLYNGNIAGWIHSARDINGTPTRALAELYGYDFLNRIVADTGVNRATGGTSWDSKPAGLGALGSSYTYDPNGNLKTLVRLDAAAQSVDNLTYTPVSSTVNLLDKVVDATTAAASSYSNDLDETQANGNYAYDAIGNLTKDVAAGIATNGIVWTPYGKIKQITNATYRIEYLYDAMGNRVRQKRTKLSDNTYVTTYYGRDASGKNVVGTYEKVGTGSTVLKEVPLYGSSRLGILRPNATQSTTAITPPAVYTRSLGRKEYEITDHLGNVRVSISDRLVKPGSDWLNDVKTQTDYFPFGMQREDRNDNVAGYRYGYNGQEHVDEIAGEGNHLTAEFWEYDPRTGRRWNMDPRPTVGISDYATFANNPVLYNDPNGDSVNVSDLYKKDNEGRYVNYTGVETFELWASTKVGREYLLSHAQKGFSLKGEIVKNLSVIAKSDGADHRAGIDIAFGWTKVDGGSAQTTHRYDGDESGNIRLKLGFLFQEDAVFRIHWNSEGNNSYRNATPQEKVLIGIDNWNHEIFLHGYLHHSNFLNGTSYESGNPTHHPLFKMTPYYSISTDMLEYFAKRMGIRNNRQDIFDSVQMPGMGYKRGLESPSKHERSSP